MRRFNWESEVFDGQLTAGIEYRFNESQLTALTQDADGDTLYLETEEIRDFSNADPVTGESPLLGEGFALGIYANKMLTLLSLGERSAIENLPSSSRKPVATPLLHIAS